MALHRAVKDGNIEEVKRLLSADNNIDINIKDTYFNTPLYYAVAKGYIEIIKLLLSHGANINSTNSSGNTPLICSVIAEHIEIVKLLLSHGADVNYKNYHHLAALHYASVRDIKIIDTLLAYGADINLSGSLNTTALHIATEKGHEQNVDYLLACGSDINSLNAFDETPLIAAVSAQRQNEVIIKSLVAYTVKLESYNIHITSEGFIKNKACIDESQTLSTIKKQCLQKIQEMKSINIGKNLSFFEVFFQKKDINTLARCANNPDIVKCQNRFPMYSSYIEKSIEEGESRAKLLQGAVESMDEIFESNQDASQESKTSWSHLPPEVRLMILENLNNDDLTKLQHNEEAEAEAEAQVEGAHAIYEGE
ncbi:ankyrin repeat domain-containing protein [Orientia tsutsugamushi]|uniref:ankyrin repeat domain-containing protein n=1 Tax=Orientia tsutsugamushi TaxID=784 RepID=UPI0009B6C491|nr:ankyrin repeat domain-containing protein [Orientia tsutsugamushi]